MSIRIRVYPQHNSVGARRNRAAKRQLVAQQRQLQLANVRLQRQLGATIPGGNAYGPASRMPQQFPGAFGFPQQYGAYGASYASPYGAPAYAGTRYGFPQHGTAQYGYGSTSPFGMSNGFVDPAFCNTLLTGTGYAPYSGLQSLSRMGPFGATMQAYQAAANYGFGWA